MTHRPAGRHHLQLLEPEQLPGQHADDDSVLRRPERAEPVPQRRDGPEAHRAGVLRRRSRRTSGAFGPNFTLNYGLRYDYFDAAAGARQPDRQVQHRHRRARSGHHAVLQVEEEQLPAARVGRPTRRSSKTVLQGRIRHPRRSRARPRIRFSRSKPSASARRSRAARSWPTRSTRT